MKAGILFAVTFALIFLTVIPGRAGKFAGIEPGRSTKEDVEAVLGAPLSTVSGGERYDYDGKRYQAKVISIRYSPEDFVVESIDIYPIPETFKGEYQDWFALEAPASTQKDERGRLVEYYFPQAVVLHYQGPTDVDPVEYFSHVPFEKREPEKTLEKVETEKSTLIASPSSVRPGDLITVKFSGVPGNPQDWIALYPAEAPGERYGEWYFLEGKTEGELSFTAPEKEGDYEFRLFADWPEGGYEAIAISDLIRVGIKPLTPGLDNELLKAAGEGDMEQVQKTLQARADVNTKGENGWTPLLRAAGQGHTKIVRTLIEAGADLDWEATTGQTALNAAAFEGHSEIVRALIEAGANVDAKSKNAQIDYFKDATALFMASRAGHTEIVWVLVQSGAEVDVRNSRGDTPLFLAALFGHTDTVRTLIEVGGDVQARAKDGATSLMYATESGKIELVWILVDAGVDVNAKVTGDVPSPYAGASALMVAAYNGHLKIVEALLIAGANVNATNNEGQTALTLASKEGHAEIVEILQEPEKSRMMARQALGQDLIKAVNEGKVEALQILIRFGADVNAKDDDGVTALLKAVEAGFIDIVLTLLDSGVDVDGTGRYGETPLMVAAAEGQNNIVEMLIQTGAEVNRKAVGDEKGEGAGWTALMLTAMENREEVMRQLLSVGADPEVTNDAGETALDIAKSEGNKEAIRLLEEAAKIASTKPEESTLTDSPLAPVGVLDLSQAPEAWARQWTVVSTAQNFAGGGSAGFYPEAVRSGDANPNRGREGILYLHPKTQKEPAKIVRRVTLSGTQPVLRMGVSGNRNVDGDWALAVKVNGQPLEGEKIIAGSQGWQDLTFDLSPFSGQAVSIEIEARANNWSYEYAFFDYVRIDEEAEEEKSLKVSVDAPPTPALGLIAYWKFDAGSGSRVQDSSGNGNDGTIQGATWTTGRFGKALAFDGKDDWLDIPDLRFDGDFTIEAWVKLTGTIGSADAIVGQEGGGQDINFYGERLRLYAPGDKVIAKTATVSDVLTHYAITRSGNQLILYYNGVPDATGTWTGDFIPKAIGRGNAGYLSGSINEVRLYSRALSQLEIEVDMKATEPAIVGTPPE